MLNTFRGKANRIEFKKTLNTMSALVSKNIRSQYRNSVLGIVWTVLNPLLNMIVMASVFSILLNRSSLDGLFFPIFILSGNTIFNLMRMTTTASLTCIVDNYDLLTKTRIPQQIFPISHMISATINFLFSLIALIIIMLIFVLLKIGNVAFNWTMFMVIFPLMPSLMMFSLGLGLILCTVYVRFRDLKHIYSIILTLWTYLTPLFYSVSIIEDNNSGIGPFSTETIVKLFKMNPMYHYVTYFRSIITGTIPGLTEHLICYGWGIGLLIIGLIIFYSNKKKFILHI